MYVYRSGFEKKNIHRGTLETRIYVTPSRTRFNDPRFGNKYIVRMRPVVTAFMREAYTLHGTVFLLALYYVCIGSHWRFFSSIRPKRHVDVMRLLTETVHPEHSFLWKKKKMVYRGGGSNGRFGTRTTKEILAKETVLGKKFHEDNFLNKVRS